MISDYLVMHPSGPFFALDNMEYNRALEKFPELANDTDVNYIEKSATGFIDVGYDMYFDNYTILAQFERLFKLIKFKKAYKNHTIEIIVDNSTTHTAKAYSLLDFGKSIGTRCPIDKIEYVDQQGVKQVIDCYFRTGPNKHLSKGLIEISKELNVKLPPKIKLLQLRDILSTHPAFKITSRLEQLADKYNIIIHFCPKFHCELNAIEGVWCYEKQFIRKKTDQTYNTMLKLLPESRQTFASKRIHLKLFRRFWHSLSAYSKGETYQEVLKLFFSNLCSGKNQSHTKITNTNLDIDD